MELQKEGSERARPPWQQAVEAHVRKSQGSEVLPLGISRDGYRLFGHSISDLQPVFEIARAARSETYTVDSARLIIDYQRMRYGDSVLYDGEKEFIELAEEELHHRRSGRPGHYNSIQALGVRPLSLVGSVFSYETTWACACAGGPPGSSVSWTTLDLTSREPVSITDLAQPESLLNALLADRCVLPAVAGEPVPTSVSQLVALLRESSRLTSECAGAAESLNAFAFFDYEVSTDRVAVRLGFPYEVSAGHTKISYLGLWVRPQPKFRESLLQAKKGNGFFVTD